MEHINSSDAQRDLFEERLKGIKDAVHLAPGIAIGFNLGLFDLIISKGQPCTISEIAESGNFKERYAWE